jgi:hypothetical protein
VYLDHPLVDDWAFDPPSVSPHLLQLHLDEELMLHEY